MCSANKMPNQPQCLLTLTSDVSEIKVFMMFVMWSCLQPARLNVFKNDQDTWDYTNPNLSGQGNMQFPILPFPLFLPLFLSCHCMGWSGSSASGGIAFVHRWLNSVFRGSIPVMPLQSCIFSPRSRLKVRAWGGTSRAANLNDRLMHVKSPTHLSQ